MGVDSFRFVTRLIQTCDMTHSDVRHDSFRYVTWSFISVTCLIQLCDMTHKYATGLIQICFMTRWSGVDCRCVAWVRHDSFVCATSLIHETPYSLRCATWLTQKYDTYIYISLCATWLLSMRVKTYPYSLRCATWLTQKYDTYIYISLCATWLLSMRVKTYPDWRHDSHRNTTNIYI